MKLVSENEIHDLTGHTRATVKKKLAGLIPKEGVNKAKLYESDKALAQIYLGGLAKKDEGGDEDFVPPSEATRRLTVARTREIDLNMEVTRKERIPIEDIEEIFNEFCGNASGLLKAHLGKVLTDESIRDILANFRAIGERIQKPT